MHFSDSFISIRIVKMGIFCLDFQVKIGYFYYMSMNFISLVLRILLVAVTCAFAWKFVEPKTQSLRILRAALLVLSLLAVLAVVKIIGI